MSADVLLEAYDRLRDTGPEWGEDQLTNHGPMAVEVLVRRGHDDRVPGWLDRYVRRLDELPHAGDRIDPADWRAALGDGRRIGDWVAFFDRELDAGAVARRARPVVAAAAARHRSRRESRVDPHGARSAHPRSHRRCAGDP